jgi:hypothetical protein
MGIIGDKGETAETSIDSLLEPMKAAFGVRNSKPKVDGDPEDGKWPDPLYRAVYKNSKEALQKRFGNHSVKNIRDGMDAEASTLSKKDIGFCWEQGIALLQALVTLWLHVVDQEEARSERSKTVLKYMGSSSDPNARPAIRNPTLQGLMNNTPANYASKPSILSLTRMCYTLGIEQAIWAYPSLMFLQPLFRAAAAAGRLARASGSCELNDYRVCHGLYAIGQNKVLLEGFKNRDPELLEAHSKLRSWMEKDGLNSVHLGNAAGEAIFYGKASKYEIRSFYQKFYLTD